LLFPLSPQLWPHESYLIANHSFKIQLAAVISDTELRKRTIFYTILQSVMWIMMTHGRMTCIYEVTKPEKIYEFFKLHDSWKEQRHVINWDGESYPNYWHGVKDYSPGEDHQWY